MISGSGAANVAGTGSVTIPLMKRVGYRPEFAGAVEAVASTGGQFMPPVMGAAAFIMAEVLGMSYGEICVRALLPAFLYYLACLLMVDFEAVKMGLKGLPRGSLPVLSNVLKEGWFLLTPILLLFILLMGLDWSPQRAAFFTIMLTLFLSFIKKSTRPTWRKAVEAMEEGAVSASVDVACLCAAAGIIVGVITLTGLGLKFSTILVDLAGNSLPLLLVLTMLASIILGMGLPPVACYVLLAVLVAPALQKMGVHPIAAHLFVFYFGMIALVTPPVAAAAYIGAGIAGADPWKTGWWAFRLAIAGFLVPYIFVYCPQLLLIGGLREIILATISSIIGILALSAALEGQYYWTKLHWFERAILFGSGIMLIKPGIYTDLLGLFILLSITLKQFYGAKRRAKVPFTIQK
jgi:TRAP transporter 4TM/12TM fusion protein